MDEITLIESPQGHFSVANRKLDLGNAMDAAIHEFVFRHNLRAEGFYDEEIDSYWGVHTYYGSHSAPGCWTVVERPNGHMDITPPIEEVTDD